MGAAMFGRRLRERSTASLSFEDVVVTAPEALGLIASAAGSRIENPGTARSFVPLPRRTRAEVSVSKFGDQVPLTIDVTAPGSAGATRAADALLTSLVGDYGWSLNARF